MSPFEIVGIRVGQTVSHAECAPGGPASPVFAHESGVENFVCDGCGCLLIDLELNLMTYGHNDYCDCEECLEREVIALAGGDPARCTQCETVFDAYADDTIDSEDGVYCSAWCYGESERKTMVAECAVA